MNRFMNEKCMTRHQAGYPPYYYLALIQVSHEDVMMAAEYAGRAVDYLRSNLSFNVSIIGPTACEY